MFTTRPELTGTFGMVASSHWLASSAGMSALERGGNAYDAAVAAGFVLQVVEPHMCGPAGEVPMLLRRGGSDEVDLLCGQGPAPAGATLERFADLGLSLVPGTGLLAACIPGAFDAWMLLLRGRGTMKLGEVLSYAIEIAERGFPNLPAIQQTVETVREMFVAHWPTSAAQWLNRGRAITSERIVNRELAATYARIVREAEASTSDREGQIEHARDSFYRGFVAQAIHDFVAGTPAIDSSGEAHTGYLTADDLATWSASYEEPLEVAYQDYRVFKAGPWSQGPVFAQQLRLLEGSDVAAMDTQSAAFVHQVVESAKLAFADREAYYGDPLFVDVPMADLLATDYTRERQALIDPARADDSLRPGRPGGREPYVPSYSAREVGTTGAGEPTLESNGVRRGDTCHLDVVDRWGNMVSATPSGGWLQSSPTIPGLGFCLGTRAQMFSLDPRAASALAPGKRPRTTLTPSFAIRDDGTCLAFGTPGGDQQDQWSLTFFVRYANHGLNLQEAIDAPAWHTTHHPSSFYPRSAFTRRVHVEDRLGQEAIDDLRRLGHDVVVEPSWSLGRLSAVLREPDGSLRAAASPRGMQGYAVGR